MKTAIKTQLLISALVLCALLLVSCTKEGEDMRNDKSNQRDMDAPGSILDRSNPTAPKKTASKEIDSFEYAFNCAFLTRPVRYEHCTFKLARSEEGAMCTAWSYGDLDAMHMRHISMALRMPPSQKCCKIRVSAITPIRPFGTSTW